MIEYAYDPENVTMVDTVFDVMSSAIVGAITGTVTQGIGVIQGVGFHHFGGGNKLLFDNKILDKALNDFYKSMVENFVKGISGTMSAGLRAAIMTGDGLEDAKAKFQDTVGLASLSKQLITFTTTWLAQLGAVSAVATAKGESLDPEGEGFFGKWRGGLRNAGYQANSEAALGGTSSDLAEGRSVLQMVGSVWGKGDFGISKDNWYKGVEQTLVTQMAGLTASVAMGLIESAVTKKKLNAGSFKAGNMEIGSEANVGIGLELTEDQEDQEPEDSPAEIEGAIHTAGDSLYNLGNRVATLADAAGTAADNAATHAPPDMAAVKAQLAAVNGLETILNQTFAPNVLANLEEASPEEADRITAVLQTWKDKVAAAKQQISDLIAHPPQAQSQGNLQQPVSAAQNP
jgi:hypothetical protein